MCVYLYRKLPSSFSSSCILLHSQQQCTGVAVTPHLQLPLLSIVFLKRHSVYCLIFKIGSVQFCTAKNMMPRTHFWRQTCCEEAGEERTVNRRARGAKRCLKKIGRSDFSISSFPSEVPGEWKMKSAHFSENWTKDNTDLVELLKGHISLDAAS